MDEIKQKLDEMRGMFDKGLDIAKELNAPEDRIVAMHTAIGGLTDRAAYENNVKPSGVPESLPVVDYEAERRAAIEQYDEVRRRGLSE